MVHAGQWPMCNVALTQNLQVYIMYARAVYRIHCQEVALATLVVTLALFKQLVRARIFSLGIHACLGVSRNCDRD